MRFLRSRFLQAVAIFLLAFVVLRFGIRPPAPWSVLRLYLTIIAMALLVFVSSDRDSWRDFVRPMWLTLTDPRYRALDNVFLTPHIGSATHDTRRAMGDLTVDNLLAHFAGRPLLTPVD